MKPKSTLRSFLALAGGSLLAISYTHAATLYWDGNDTTGIADGGAGNWDNTLTNWDTLAAAGANADWTAGDIAVFSVVGAGYTATLTDNITVGGLVFNKVNGDNDVYTINAATNSKTLSFSSGDNYIRMNIGNGGAPTATITGQVAGTGANVIIAPQNIVASGGGTNFGTVIFNGASTGGWTGTTTINGAANFSTVSTAALTNRVLANTSGITLNGGTLQFTRDSNSNIDAITSNAIGVNGGGTFSVTSTNGGASAIENIGTVTVNSGQMNFVQTANNANQLVLADLSRGSSTTSAVTFSSAAFGTAKFVVTANGGVATTAGEIFAPWATVGATAAAQTDYAVFNASNEIGAAGIAATAQSGWSTTHALGSNYTMGSTAGAGETLGASRMINTLRLGFNAVSTSHDQTTETFTRNAHGFVNGDLLGASGTQGLTAGTPYYVVGATANTFQLSLTPGGAAVNLSNGVAGQFSRPLDLAGNDLGTYGILSGTAPLLINSSGGKVTLPTTTSGKLFVTAGTTGAISISAPIKNNGAGALTLVKGGSGLLTLSSTGNDYSGGLVVNAGTVLLTGDQSFTGGVTLNGGSLGDLTNGISAAEIDSNSVTVNGNAAMVITGGETLAGDIAINSTGFLRVAAIASSGTLSGVVSGTGVLTNSAPGNGNGTIILSNTANTHTGIVSIVSDNNQNFTMAVNSLADSAGAGNIQMGGGGAAGGYTFALHSGAIAPLILNNRQVELVGDGAGASMLFKLSNNSTTQAFTINTDLLASGTNVKTLTLGGVANAGLSTFAGTITNGSHTTLNLAKADANNTWALTNSANSYNGITTITAGTLRVSSLANGGSNSSIGSASNVAGNLILNGGTLQYTGAGTTTDRLFSLQTSSTIDASGTGALNFNNTGAMGFNGGVANKTLTLTGSNTGANTIAAVIGNNTGTTGITKSGVGKWVISANNTYTGTTTLNAGTLTLDYSTSNTSKLPDATGILALNGGTLELSGGSHVEAVTSTTLNTGTTFVKLTSRTARLNMGVITYSGGALDFAAADIANVSTSTVTNGILSSVSGTARVTVGGTDWAAKDGSNNVIAYTGYEVGNYAGGAMTAAKNYALAGSTSITTNRGAVTNTLKITTTAASESIAIDTGATFTLGSMLFAGANDYAISTAGTGKIAATLLHNYGAGSLTLGTLGVALTQYGTGKTILNGGTALGDYGMIIAGGTVQISDNLQIGTNTTVKDITLNNGTLVASQNLALDADGAGLRARTITLGAGGGTLAAASTKTLTVTGVISGALNPLTVGNASSTGTVTLTAANTYTGATTVSNGTMNVSAGNINSTSNLTVAAGAKLAYNSSTALTVAPTLNGAGLGNRAVLGGTGTINTAVILDNIGDTLSPGNSPGIEPFAVGQTWAAFSYDWEINDFSDVTGLTAGSDFDQIGITGGLTLTGAVANSYYLNILSLTAGNVTGLAQNFSEINRSWNILTTTAGITGFNASYWNINSTGFTNVEGGTWSIAQSGNNLVLSYTAVPEPRAALLGGLGLLMLLRRRR